MKPVVLGSPGNVGEKGDKGDQGQKGDLGTGVPGKQGPQGNTGLQGSWHVRENNVIWIRKPEGHLLMVDSKILLEKH